MHSVNYRGYIISKNVLKRKDNASKSSKIGSQYKSLVPNNIQSRVSLRDSDIMHLMYNTMKTLQQINKRLDRLENKKTVVL